MTPQAPFSPDIAYNRDTNKNNMKSKTGKIITGIISGIIVFIGGYAIGSHSTSAASTASARGSFAAGGTTGFSATGRTGFTGTRGAAPGAVTGQIVSVEPSTNSISVELPNSTSTSATTGSEVVLYSPSTAITKTVAGSPSDSPKATRSSSRATPIPTAASRRPRSRSGRLRRTRRGCNLLKINF